MKSAAGAAKRPYRMTARAAAADQTRQRILDATIALHEERYHDEISLGDVAARANVTVQTVLRHVGSKQGLMDAAAKRDRAEVQEQRWAAPIGDIRGAVENLLDHYEDRGPIVLRLLAQEDRVAGFPQMLDVGRRLHHEWVARTFGPLVAADASREAVLAQVAVITDVYAWKLLRIDQGHDRATTADLLVSMLEAVLADRRKP